MLRWGATREAAGCTPPDPYAARSAADPRNPKRARHEIRNGSRGHRVSVSLQVMPLAPAHLKIAYVDPAASRGARVRWMRPRRCLCASAAFSLTRVGTPAPIAPPASRRCRGLPRNARSATRVVAFGTTAGSQAASTSLTAHFGAVADVGRVARGSVSAGLSFRPAGSPPSTRGSVRRRRGRCRGG
jgi:hypothetical protein